MGVEYILKAMWMTFVFYWWGNSLIWYQGSYHTVDTWHDKVRFSVNPNKTGLVFTRGRKLPISLDTFLGLVYIALCW